MLFFSSASKLTFLLCLTPMLSPQEMFQRHAKAFICSPGGATVLVSQGCQQSVASWCNGRPDQMAIKEGAVEVCAAVAEEGDMRMDGRLQRKKTEFHPGNHLCRYSRNLNSISFSHK